MADRPSEDAVDGRRWRPEAIAATERFVEVGVVHDNDRYVIVEELIDERAVMRVTPWPVVDSKGRLRFPRRDVAFVSQTAATAWRELADRSREVSRPLRVGDVFWAMLPTRRGRRPSDLSRLVVGPIVDVSAAAREAAKLQYFSAVATVFGEDEIATMYRDLGPPRRRR